MTILDYGFDPKTVTQNDPGIPARITAVHRGRYEIVCDAGQGFARLKTGAYRTGSSMIPTAGDFVLLDWQPNSDSRILKTLPRKTFLSRADPTYGGQREQAIAANFDTVFLLQALDQRFSLHRLERCLALVLQSGASPVFILTKADAAQDCAPQVRAVQAMACSAPVHTVSARTGAGLDALSRYLAPAKTIVLLGASGAGKSTLVNALARREIMQTGQIREKDGRGRHTTTGRQLILLENGAILMDTPGIRELGLWETQEGIAESFPDIQQYLGQCKFRDCRHQGEPGCAISRAIRQGELSPERWESYQKLMRQVNCGGKKPKSQSSKGAVQENENVSRKHKASEPDYRISPCEKSFTCRVCGALVTPEDAGSAHRNHCPHCLCSLHVDNQPGDRASLCRGIMEPIGVWVRKNGEWAIIHRCRSCGKLISNRIAADDNSALLLSIAVKPLASPPFPLWQDTGAEKQPASDTHGAAPKL